MLLQRVDVVLLSLFKQLLQWAVVVLTIIVLLWFSAFVSSQAAPESSSVNPQGYVARIHNDSPEEVADALRRAEMLYLEGKLSNLSNPLAIVLHGPEVEIFFKDKYEQYKEIVDLAARLSAFGVVDVQVCVTQTGIMGRDRSSVHSFIGTVPFGPSEVKRLLNQQSYVYF
jgi:intracellular sulfur oxidation DsrE/DsrF family protein